MGGEIKVDGEVGGGILGGGDGGTGVISVRKNDGFSDGMLPNADEVKGGAENRN